MGTKMLTIKRALSDRQAEKLKATFLTDDSYDVIITEDTDAYDHQGNLLFRFRKGALSHETIKLGYESFKDSVKNSNMRGAAAGLKKDKMSSAHDYIGVQSGNVGYMDAGMMVRYCRKTAFAREYFEEFKEGIPFVKAVDELYKELCPVHYKLQKIMAESTNRNYVIGDTSFTTVTVNKNFRTAVHKDAGDFPRGFGNLCVYREGDWGGSYFVLPEFRVAIDLQNTDMLFVDVHRWHANSPYRNFDPERGDLRISFVMYYREYMHECKSPKAELKRVQIDQGGYLKM